MGDIQHSYTLQRLTLTQVRSIGSSSGAGSPCQPIDLKGIFTELVLYHSIDEICNSGYVKIQEQGILPLDAPIIGWERIDIIFKIDKSTSSIGSKNSDSFNKYSGVYARTFFVYAIDNLKEEKDVRTYIIRFADLSALINSCTRIEKRYKGRAENIIKEIANINAFKYSYGELTSGQSAFSQSGESCINIRKSISTKEDMDFIAPCMRPFTFIKRIVSMAMSSGGSFCDCVFYQQIDGSFEFNSYKDILSGSPISVINTPQVFNGPPQLPSQISVVSYNFDRLFNAQSSANSGIMGNTVKIFDLTTMKIKTIANYYNYNPNSGGYVQKPSGLIVSTIIPTGCDTTKDAVNMIDKYQGYGLNKSNTTVSKFAIKQSPVSNVYMTACGANQETKESTDGSAADYNKMSIIKNSLGRGTACQAITRSTAVTIEFNPNVELNVGDLINIQYTGTSNGQQKVLNGIFWIGSIKYVLTMDTFSVFAECFSNNIEFTGKSRFNASPSVYFVDE